MQQDQSLIVESDLLVLFKDMQPVVCPKHPRLTVSYVYCGSDSKSKGINFKPTCVSCYKGGTKMYLQEFLEKLVQATQSVNIENDYLTHLKATQQYHENFLIDITHLTQIVRDNIAKIEDQILKITRRYEKTQTDMKKFTKMAFKSQDFEQFSKSLQKLEGFFEEHQSELIVKEQVTIDTKERQTYQTFFTRFNQKLQAIQYTIADFKLFQQVGQCLDQVSKGMKLFTPAANAVNESFNSSFSNSREMTQLQNLLEDVDNLSFMSENLFKQWNFDVLEQVYYECKSKCKNPKKHTYLFEKNFKDKKEVFVNHDEQIFGVFPMPFLNKCPDCTKIDNKYRTKIKEVHDRSCEDW